MSALFLVGAIALVIGVLSLLFDGALDLPDSEWFSLTGLSAGVAMFGFIAGLLVGSGAPLWLASIPGGIVAIGVMAGASWLVYRLRHAAPGPDLGIQSLVGEQGVVSTGLPLGGTSEIDLSVNGERFRLYAVSDEEIPAGATAEVVDVVSPTCVRVVQLR